MHFPKDFLAFGRHIGIKPAPKLDFGVVHSLRPASAAVLFTRNNFPGNPVILGREHAADGRLRTVIVNSGNSNVATGAAGLALVREYCGIAARNLEIEPELILPSSTGVIGRPLPADILRGACAEIKSLLKEADFPNFSRAILTTDTHEKIFSRELKSGVRVTGVAKGVGMIQPDMATMLAYVFTDAEIEVEDLRRLTRSIANRTFNRVSIDGDTSTSDTFAVLANGASGTRVRFPESAAAAFDADGAPPFEDMLLDPSKFLGDLDEVSAEFVGTLAHICRDLTRLVASDGEGASKLITLRVTEAASRLQALKIGRSVINSPLVKTAVRGADPNWGRLVMAVGKVFDEPIELSKFRIFLGDQELPIGSLSAAELRPYAEYLKNKEVFLRLSLGQGTASETLWGCDLTEEYININAYYTT